MNKKIKAAFFDRDGTLIKDVNYLSDINQVEILHGAVQLCVFLQRAGYKLFVVTNQSGIARGFFNEAFIEKTHRFLYDLFKEKGVCFQNFYYCPHHPQHAIDKKYLKNCACRKPKAGMLLQAAKDFNIDLKRSLMFGDTQRDFQAGQAAGCKSFYVQRLLSLSCGELKSKKWMQI